jgi:2,5-dihydroxypyridine 5,6-dioxygenase
MALGMGLLNAWQHVLTLSKVSGDETVVILAGEETNPDHIAAARMALSLLGARSLTVQLGEPPNARVAGETTAYYGPTALTGNLPAVEAMKNAEMVIDLMGIDRGTEQKAILDSGTRVLLVKEPPEVFIRLLPSEEDRRRVLAAKDVLAQARTMRITSEHGTDLQVSLGEYPSSAQYGFSDVPGRWDHCPSAFVAIWPDEKSAQGTVVLGPGDAILPFKSYVRTPIRLTIRDGYIREIDGDFDAEYLREYMARFDDVEGYAVSHLGWGLHAQAHWTTLGMYDKRQTAAMDARSFYGNFMFSTGPNARAGRHTACHLDIPMRNCSVHVDGAPMVIKGDVVVANQKA